LQRIKLAILSLVAIFLALLAAELGWRTYLYFSGHGFFDDPREFISPFFTGFEEPVPYFDGGQLVYRNATVPRDKGESEIRVICFGGSTTVGRRAGVSYPELLDERFAESIDGYRVRVLNAGSEAYSTAHFLVNLGLRNLDADPDIITIYENVNDLTASWFSTDPVLPDYAQKYQSGFYLGLRHRSGILAELARVSRLARFLFSRIEAIAYPATPPVDSQADLERGIALFERNLRSIIAVAQTHGIRVLLATQPSESTWRTNPGAVAFNRAIAAAAASEGVAFVDVAAQVTDDNLFLPGDSIHNNRAGVQAVADALYWPLRAEVDAVVHERSARREFPAGSDSPSGSEAKTSDSANAAHTDTGS
jgi:lysophospholipase L1-like esterase